MLIVPDAANAQYQYYPQNPGLFGSSYGSNYYGSPYWNRPRPLAPADPYYFKPQRKVRDRPGQRQGIKKTAKEPKVKAVTGPLLIAISLNSQQLTLYSKGAAIAHSPVSTGTESHPTPTGIFSVIGKEKFHRSNLYSNAPMPFMQRITWSGVALHQGALPGYPASHGCIRLPGQFAQYLWGTTRMGARVIITRNEVAPFDIAHAKLFAPKQEEPSAGEVSAIRATKIAETDHPVTSSDAPKPAATQAPTPADGARAAKSSPAGADRSARPQGATGERAAAAAELSDVIDARPPSLTATDGTTANAVADSIDKGARAAGPEVKDTPRMSERFRSSSAARPDGCMSGRASSRCSTSR